MVCRTYKLGWLSHLLLGTKYDETPFDLLKPLEPQLFDSARGIAKGDINSIETLMRTLLLSGLGMTIAGGSYPASQGEHMIAHAMHMLSGVSLPQTFHGEEIGVTTLYMAKLQEALLQKRPELRADTFDTEAMTKLFGAASAAEAKKTYDIKQNVIRHSRDNKNAIHWDDIAHKIAAIRIPSEKIHAALKAADAPDAPEKLGWDMADFNTAATHARFLRDRFTFLDL